MLRQFNYSAYFTITLPVVPILDKLQANLPAFAFSFPMCCQIFLTSTTEKFSHTPGWFLSITVLKENVFFHTVPPFLICTFQGMLSFPIRNRQLSSTVSPLKLLFHRKSCRSQNFLLKTHGECAIRPGLSGKAAMSYEKSGPEAPQSHRYVCPRPLKSPQGFREWHNP